MKATGRFRKMSQQHRLIDLTEVVIMMWLEYLGDVTEIINAGGRYCVGLANYTVMTVISSWLCENRSTLALYLLVCDEQSVNRERNRSPSHMKMIEISWREYRRSWSR